VYALFGLALTGSLVLLALSVYPGVLADLAFMSVLFVLPCGVPMLLGGLVVLSLVVFRKSKAKKPGFGDVLSDDAIGTPPSAARTRPWGRLAMLVSLASFALLVGGVPRRAAFWWSRPAFEALVANAPVDGYAQFGGAVAGWVGLYHVDRYAVDRRGGVYFRTHSGPDGIGPDTMSYGFAYRPNAVGSPFGRAGYRVSRLAGDWYVFRASDDSF
jgi:hypothetical protein